MPKFLSPNGVSLSLDEFQGGKIDRVSLGITRDTAITGQVRWLTDKQRETTVYVRGKTGTGKSRLMQAMVAQDICRGHPFALVDPTGSIYTPTVELLGRLSIPLEMQAKTGKAGFDRAKRKQLDDFYSRFDLLDFSDPNHGFRYNPLYVDHDEKRGETAPQVAGDFMKAVERVIGTLSDTRRLKIILESACQLLAEAGGTLLDVPTLLRMDEGQIRTFLEQLDLKAKHENMRVRSDLARWYMEEFFAVLHDRDRLERMESTINAMGVWLSDPLVRRFVNCRKGNLDFWKILNEGRFLLCHIPLGANTDTTRVLGSLIVNKIQRQAYRRNRIERDKPFSLYADEFHLFVDQEFAVATATVRQYGLRLLLAHQAGDQPPLNTEEGQGVLNTIMANSGTKIFFRLGVDDAKAVADEVFLREGKEFKRSFADITTTVQRSMGFASAKAISESLAAGLTSSSSQTFTDQQSGSITFTEGDGVQKATIHSHGITVTKGKNSSRTVSKAQGITITDTEGETHVEATGISLGESSAKGKSFTVGSSRGTSLTHSESHGTSVSFNKGMSSAPVVSADDPHGMRTAMQEGMSEAASDAISKGFSLMESEHKSESESLQEAISKVLSASKSLARTRSRAIGRTDTETVADAVGESSSEAQSKSLSEGVTEIVNRSKAIGESIARAVSTMAGTALSQTRTKSETRTETKSQTIMVGQSRTERIEFYTMEDEAVLNAQKLYTLPPRQAWIVTNPDFELEQDEFGESGELDVVEIKTHTVESTFLHEHAGRNYLADFVKAARPAKVEPPERSIFADLNMDITPLISAAEPAFDDGLI